MPCPVSTATLSQEAISAQRNYRSRKRIDIVAFTLDFQGDRTILIVVSDCVLHSHITQFTPRKLMVQLP